MTVWEYTVAFWEGDRYIRCRTLLIERRFQKSLQFQADRAKSQKARREALTSSLAEIAAQRPSDIAAVTGQEIAAANLVEEFDEILKRTPTELDNAEALESSLAVHKDFELLIVSATKRKNEALRLLDWYRAGLGKETQDAMNDIVDAEYEEVLAVEAQALVSPPLAPADDEAAKEAVE